MVKLWVTLESKNEEFGKQTKALHRPSLLQIDVIHLDLKLNLMFVFSKMTKPLNYMNFICASSIRVGDTVSSSAV